MTDNDFKLATTMAQQLYGVMIAIDDDLNKVLVVRCFAAMIGIREPLEPLTGDERKNLTAILQEISQGMN